jgi:hypothetical protein
MLNGIKSPSLCRTQYHCSSLAYHERYVQMPDYSRGSPGTRSFAISPVRRNLTDPRGHERHGTGRRRPEESICCSPCYLTFIADPGVGPASRGSNPNTATSGGARFGPARRKELSHTRFHRIGPAATHSDCLPAVQSKRSANLAENLCCRGPRSDKSLMLPTCGSVRQSLRIILDTLILPDGVSHGIIGTSRCNHRRKYGGVDLPK